MFLPDPVETENKYFPEMSKLFVDIETTGLEPIQGHKMLSIGAIRQIRSNLVPPWEDAVKEFEVTIKISREDFEKASPEALAVNGVTYEYIEEHGIPFDEAMDKFIEFVMPALKTKCIHVGQNPGFDIKFLASECYKPLSFVGYPLKNPIDVIELFKTLQQFDKTLYTAKYNGHAISKALGVEEEAKIHTAMGGTRAVYRNYWALFKRWEIFERDLRREVNSGNVSRAIPLPFACISEEEFRQKSGELGWTYAGSTQYVDKDGQRYSLWWGLPPILYTI